MLNDVLTSRYSEISHRASTQHHLGYVVACDGTKATIEVNAENRSDITQFLAVGRMVSIKAGSNRIVAMIYALDATKGNGIQNQFHLETELLGEISIRADGVEEFSAGISHYPSINSIVETIKNGDLSKIYEADENETSVIGHLTQDSTIEAAVHIPSLVSRHFALIGSTGVGKSTAVALLINKAVKADSKLRVVILDPHNEYAAAFSQNSIVIDPDNLDLPFWLMRLDEFAEVVFRGRSPVPEELDILREIMPEAKRAFRGNDKMATRRHSEKSSITADTPVPYRIADLLTLIDERLGRLEGRSEKPVLRSLKNRIIAALNDPRYTFMFSNSTISDTILETLAHIFRIPGDDKPICVFQLAGIPSEVLNSVASVLCRMAFEIGLWSGGAVHLLLVCEEAHRYVPSDPKLGFFPTRQAIGRIAKEGRKYDVAMGIITQRPGEIDPTILSQCSTIFAMRLSNDLDQEIVRTAIPHSSISTTAFLSSISNGEAIAFGEAIKIPMRMRFSRVADHLLPKAHGMQTKAMQEDADIVDLSKIVDRMRSLAKKR